MIGMNKSTLAVVSNIITARANVIRVAPESMAVAPRMAKNDSGILPFPLVVSLKKKSSSAWNIELCNFAYIVPSAHPMRMQGKNIPAGTMTPEVMHVKPYHTTRNITMFIGILS